jgi:hypothetical protein
MRTSCNCREIRLRTHPVEKCAALQVRNIISQHRYVPLGHILTCVVNGTSSYALFAIMPRNYRFGNSSEENELHGEVTTPSLQPYKAGNFKAHLLNKCLSFPIVNDFQSRTIHEQQKPRGAKDKLTSGQICCQLHLLEPQGQVVSLSLLYTCTIREEIDDQHRQALARYAHYKVPETCIVVFTHSTNS